MTYYPLRGRTRCPGIVYLPDKHYLSLKETVPTIFDTNTTFSITIPSNVVVGDLLVINLFARDTLTPPSNWTLAKSEVVISGTTTQTAYMYYKNAEVGDAGSSVSFIQNSSQRYGIQLIVISTDSPFGAKLESAVSASSSAVVTQPAQTSLKDGNLAVGFIGILIMYSGSAFLHENGWTPIDPVTSSLLRLCGGTCPAKAGSVPSWTFSNGILASYTTAICSVFTSKA